MLDHSGNAAVAAATACSSSAVPSSGTRRFASPVAGIKNFGKRVRLTFHGLAANPVGNGF